MAEAPIEKELDELFESVNDVTYCEGFREDLAQLRIPVRSAYSRTHSDETETLRDPAITAICHWLTQELQYFMGSARNVVGAEAQQIRKGSLWIVSVELIQLVGHSVSIIFDFDDAAQIVRVLAAMHSDWMKKEFLRRAKVIVAEQRLAALNAAELMDEVQRTSVLLTRAEIALIAQLDKR